MVSVVFSNLSHYDISPIHLKSDIDRLFNFDKTVSISKIRDPSWHMLAIDIDKTGTVGQIIKTSDEEIIGSVFNGGFRKNADRPRMYSSLRSRDWHSIINFFENFY